MGIQWECKKIEIRFHHNAKLKQIRLESIDLNKMHRVAKGVRHSEKTMVALTGVSLSFIEMFSVCMHLESHFDGTKWLSWKTLWILWLLDSEEYFSFLNFFQTIIFPVLKWLLRDVKKKKRKIFSSKERKIFDAINFEMKKNWAHDLNLNVIEKCR